MLEQVVRRGVGAEKNLVLHTSMQVQRMIFGKQVLTVMKRTGKANRGAGDLIACNEYSP